jgi:hypothetical protein
MSTAAVRASNSSRDGSDVPSRRRAGLAWTGAAATTARSVARRARRSVSRGSSRRSSLGGIRPSRAPAAATAHARRRRAAACWTADGWALVGRGFAMLRISPVPGRRICPPGRRPPRTASDSRRRGGRRSGNPSGWKRNRPPFGGRMVGCWSLYRRYAGLAALAQSLKNPTQRGE